MTLPDPMGGAIARVVKVPFAAKTAKEPDRPIDDDPTGRIAATVASGLAQHLEITPSAEHAAIIARVEALQTRAQALEYLKEVHTLVQAARRSAGVEPSASVRLRVNRDVRLHLHQ
jgi:hypothetical protein